MAGKVGQSQRRGCSEGRASEDTTYPLLLLGELLQLLLLRQQLLLQLLTAGLKALCVLPERGTCEA